MGRKWSDALLSGEYKQGHTYLKKDDMYCCMGVLCDIHPQINWNDVLEENLTETVRSMPVEDMGIPPKSVSEETGLNNELTSMERWLLRDLLQVPVYVGTKRYTALYQMNDTMGFNFAQIALIIKMLGWDVEFQNER